MTAAPEAAAGHLLATILEALRAAAVVLAESSPRAIHPDRVVADQDGIAKLLGLLEQSPQLRSATAARLTPMHLRAETPDDEGLPTLPPVVAALTSPDAKAASKAVADIHKLLDEQRRATRRARRQQERAARPPVDQRRDDRAQSRLSKLREARDQARRRANLAEAEAQDLRARITELGDDLAALSARTEAAEAQLEVARSAAANPLRLAAALAAVLQPEEQRVAPRDSRGRGPGEPVQVDPGRRVGATVDLARLRAAAGAAGLPPVLAETVSAWLPTLLSTFVEPPRPVAHVYERELQVDVLGGGTEIGGSCVLITAGDTRILVDAGSRPGGRTPDELAPPRIAEALAGPLHGIVITHAHNDHAGWVPAVLLRSRQTPVLTTDATAALLATMWFDSAKVLARRGDADGPASVPYGREDVQHALRQTHTVPFGRRHRLGEFEVELFPAGHVVGAAGVVVHVGNRRIVVSGDVSRSRQRTVGGIAVPDSAKNADLLLLESTYAGAGRLTPRDVTVTALATSVAAITSAGGRVLIPAFALGRAQEVALTLTEQLSDVDIRIDGLARDVSSVYEQQPGPDGAPLRIFGPRIRAVPPGGTHEAIGSLRSGVVIATSGMLTAGPAVSWARALLPDPRAGLMVVGYQDEDSPGGRLLALAEAGGGYFELPTADGPPSKVRVAAQVGRFGLGAHATADELVAITTEVAAGQVMLVHGEPASQEKFAERLRLRSQATTETGAWTA